MNQACMISVESVGGIQDKKDQCNRTFLKENDVPEIYGKCEWNDDNYFRYACLDSRVRCRNCGDPNPNFYDWVKPNSLYVKPGNQCSKPIDKSNITTIDGWID